MAGRDPIGYAHSGNVAIAYSVSGEGPRDLVFAHGFAGNVEIEREIPFMREFHDRAARFSRFVAFDRRGTGLSDRPREPPTLEDRMDDIRAVMDALNSQRAVLFGTSEAASVCILFAATYPERTLGLALFNPLARGTWAPDYPWAASAQEWKEQIDDTARNWGTYEYAEREVRAVAPTHADDPAFIATWSRHYRLSASPGAAATLERMIADVDVRDVLGAIRVPTLVAHVPGVREEAMYVADRIPGARRFEVPGPDVAIYLQAQTLLPELERFTASLDVEEMETILATVLFTDIVGSTAKLVELGDARWRELVEQHHAVIRQQLGRFRGTEVDTAGDGFFATFDGPIRAIRCASAITASLRELGLEVRAGLHTGECEVIGDKITGIAVNIGARIAARAGPGEVLVSSTVKDLVAGSGLAFEDVGEHHLKGIPDTWRIYRVSTDT
jgi:class 3 adenylate cyclase/alpha-beta hydrolase superfamily lysophospholipase